MTLKGMAKRLPFRQFAAKRTPAKDTERDSAPQLDLDQVAASQQADWESWQEELDAAFGTTGPRQPEPGEVQAVQPTKEAVPGQDDYEAGMRLAESGDSAQALEALSRAGSAGHREAQFLCGQMYRQAGNDRQALAWYRKAAQQGHLSAQLACAVMYEKGLGAAMDLKRALSWYERAARQGSIGAQLKCGQMYFCGRAETRNPKKARRWLEEAASGGNEKARQLLLQYF